MTIELTSMAAVCISLSACIGSGVLFLVHVIKNDMNERNWLGTSFLAMLFTTGLLITSISWHKSDMKIKQITVMKEILPGPWYELYTGVDYKHTKYSNDHVIAAKLSKQTYPPLTLEGFDKFGKLCDIGLVSHGATIRALKTYIKGEKE